MPAPCTFWVDTKVLTMAMHSVPGSFIETGCMRIWKRQYLGYFLLSTSAVELNVEELCTVNRCFKDFPTSGG